MRFRIIGLTNFLADDGIQHCSKLRLVGTPKETSFLKRLKFQKLSYLKFFQILFTDFM
jgi:hypothetical protein